MVSADEDSITSFFGNMHINDCTRAFIDDYFAKKPSSQDKIIRSFEIVPSEELESIIKYLIHVSLKTITGADLLKSLLIRSFKLLKDDLKSIIYAKFHKNLNSLVSSDSIKLAVEEFYDCKEGNQIFPELLQILCDQFSNNMRELVPDAQFYRQGYCDMCYLIFLFFTIHAKKESKPSNSWLQSFYALCGFIQHRLREIKKFFVSLSAEPLPDDWSHLKDGCYDAPAITRLDSPLDYSPENLANSINLILTWLRWYLTASHTAYVNTALKDCALNALLSSSVVLFNHLEVPEFPCVISSNSSENHSDNNSFGEDPEIMMEFQKFLAMSGQKE